MADDLDAQIRDRLRHELLDVHVSDPTWDRVVTKATAAQPDRRGLLVVAASVATLLAVLLSVSLRPTAPTVVLEAGPEERSWPRPATIDDVFGMVLESTGELPGAPDPSGTLTLVFVSQLPDDEVRAGDARLIVVTEPGCNGGSVAVELAGDGTLRTVSSVISTRLGCPGAPQEMDSWAASLVTSQPVLQLLGSDRLQLQTADGVAIDLTARPLPDQPSTPPSTSSGEGVSCDVAGQQLAAVLAERIAGVDPDDIDAGSSTAASVDVDAAVGGVSATANCPAEEIRVAAANRLQPALQQQLDADAIAVREPLIDAVVGMLLPPQPPPPEARIPARPTTTVPPAAEATGERGDDLAATVVPGWVVAEPGGAYVEVMALQGALALPPGAVSLRRYDTGTWIDVPIEPFGVNALAGLGARRPFPIGITPATGDGVLQPGWYEVRVHIVEARGTAAEQPVVMTIGTAVLVPSPDADLAGLSSVLAHGAAAAYGDAVLEVRVDGDDLVVRNSGTSPIATPTYEVIAYRDRYWIPTGPAVPLTDLLDAGQEISIPIDQLLDGEELVRVRVGSAPAPIATLEIAQ